ncbi:hypothetical protein C8Q74DRAFT_690053 [Fomes fomentarius]|nr:hypothetical protein C8Q74DRAFT_690053 [Fomes fomentarius]
MPRTACVYLSLVLPWSQSTPECRPLNNRGDPEAAFEVLLCSRVKSSWSRPVLVVSGS